MQREKRHRRGRNAGHGWLQRKRQCRHRCILQHTDHKALQTAGPCSWACRRLLRLPPHRKRNAARPPPARGAGVLFSVRHSGARGKEGAVPCDAALPRWGKGRCRCAGSTLFAPAGQKRFRVARLILGVSRERAVCGAVCPSGMAGRRAGETEACRPMLHEAATFLPPSRGENGGLCPHPLKGPDP